MVVNLPDEGARRMKRNMLQQQQSNPHSVFSVVYCISHIGSKLTEEYKKLNKE
jgi:hypothetical protein